MKWDLGGSVARCARAKTQCWWVLARRRPTAGGRAGRRPADECQAQQARPRSACPDPPFQTMQTQLAVVSQVLLHHQKRRGPHRPASRDRAALLAQRPQKAARKKHSVVLGEERERERATTRETTKRRRKEGTAALFSNPPSAPSLLACQSQPKASSELRKPKKLHYCTRSASTCA